MERWMMNRAGFINFWYYDEEVYDFEDGRLLLRGSNGSGKSVTMQSLIPLLLDGNKSPERLDPFGSRARRIENYLLDDNSEDQERTGYIYLEFCKKSSDTYLTIGMGMKAVRNKPLDWWGFLIADNRRIGSDLTLVSTAEHIPLTKRELRNRIGSGGEVIESQRDYMRRVNELLFGYDLTDDYDELIKLLIQLRSPKLSKDFKPTVIYEILSNSLQTLSDDDLRPMSEAIENMDNMKSQLENLERSLTAADKIKSTYDRYNEAVLYEVANKYLSTYEKVSKTEKDIKKYSDNIIALSQKSVELNDKIQELETEQMVLADKRKQLEENDAFKLKETLSDHENRFKDIETKKKDKTKRLDDAYFRERRLDSNIKNLRAEAEALKKNIKETLSEMDDLAEAISFDEHEFFSAEFAPCMETQYSFKYVRSKITEYKSSLSKAVNVLLKESVKRSDYDSKCREADELRKKCAQLEKLKNDAELLFSELKSEYIERINKFNNSCRYVQLTKDELFRASALLYEFNEKSSYEDVRKIFNDTCNVHKANVTVEIRTTEELITKKQLEISAKDQEILSWQNMKDPEPVRREETIRNRQKLAEMGIPFVPLYKAIDFDESVEDDVRNNIEEAFTDMGILDALVIPEKYYEQIRISDEGMCDKYIFADPSMLSYELSCYLKPESSGNPMIGEIYDVIRSFLAVNDDTKPYITEDGNYKLGTLYGNVSKNYESKFIGINSRRRYRKQVIDRLLEEREILADEKNILQNELKQKEDVISAIEEEAAGFPDGEDLYTAVRTLSEAAYNYDNATKNAESVENQAKIKYEELTKIRQELNELCRSISLKPISLDVYIEAGKSAESYAELLHNTEKFNDKLVALTASIAIDEERLEELKSSISEYIGEISSIDVELEMLSMKIANCIDQLRNSDYDKLKAEIDNCIKRLSELPAEIKENVKAASACETENKNAKDKEQELKIVYEAEIVAADSSYASFVREYERGYTSLKATVQAADVNTARNICQIYSTDYKSDISVSNCESRVREAFYQQRNFLTDYSLDLAAEERDGKICRIILTGKIQGKIVDFYTLRDELSKRIDEHKNLIRESDRIIFEDILANTMSKKIRAKIYSSKQWVEKMNSLMESLDTSSGLKFSLRWKNKKAETEDELGTSDLVKFLEQDSRILPQSEIDKFTRHFRSKVNRVRREIEDKGENRTFHAIMRDILDYRQWFEFQLYFTKTNEKSRELTNNAFYTFSGGEKAMAMYVPLFSAVYSRYEGARNDAPKLISLDEAFAGVDSQNIRDMFRLLVELDLSFIMNSQVLWGDYDTVPKLAVYELLRPNNASWVSTIRYVWNGSSLVLDLTKTEDGDTI